MSLLFSFLLSFISFSSSFFKRERESRFGSGREIRKVLEDEWVDLLVMAE